MYFLATNNYTAFDMWYGCYLPQNLFNVTVIINNEKESFYYTVDQWEYGTLRLLGPEQHLWKVGETVTIYLGNQIMGNWVCYVERKSALKKAFDKWLEGPHRPPRKFPKSFFKKALKFVKKTAKK